MRNSWLHPRAALAIMSFPVMIATSVLAQSVKSSAADSPIAVTKDWLVAGNGGMQASGNAAKQLPDSSEISIGVLRDARRALRNQGMKKSTSIPANGR